jgi:uncharacterized SAM-binding protein YcdF (DUF218 family)
MSYIEPLLAVFIGIALVGLWAIRRQPAKYLALAGVLGLFLVSWPPIDWLIAQPLQARYPVRPFLPPPGLQAIAVLGSSIAHPEYERPYPRPDWATYDRCEYTAWIYRQHGPLPVLVCEGFQKGAKDAQTMKTLLVRAGVDEKMIWEEQRAGSTLFNAVYGGEILRAHGVKRIAVVVDVQSMPRAAGCFRKEGFDVTPAPMDFRTWGPWQDEVLPTWKSVRRNEIALHEWLGLAWYRWHGWI